MAYVTDFAKELGQKKPLPPTQIVYVTAVLSRMYDPLYERALRKVRERHRYAAILSAKSLWANREGWLATHEALLSAVTHVYIMPNLDYSVGQGIFLELAHLYDLRPTPIITGIFTKRLIFQPISARGPYGDRTPECFGWIASETFGLPKGSGYREAPQRSAKSIKRRKPRNT
jgi:hypothetical protein